MKTKEVVKQLLIDTPHLRDSDPKLIATYWFNELKAKQIDPNNINGLEFMQMFANGKLTNIKTIERMRRKLQEEQPDRDSFKALDKLYKVRKETIQDQWKKDLGYGN